MSDDAYVALGIVIAVVVVVLLLRKIVGAIDKAITAMLHGVREKHARDVKRVYLKSEKTVAAQMCGWRCEGTGLIFRCRYKGDDLQGDHWYPHARGGATTQVNLVMLCPKCNRKKSAHIPTRAQTKALRRRRKKYAEGELIKPGQWLPRDYRGIPEAPTRSRGAIPMDW